MTSARPARRLLDFDDLLLRAATCCATTTTSAAATQAGITLLMVDEFQDTDPIQDDIVRMLCGDGLLTGGLFVVGDAKQSIYRFRRAEPRVFPRVAAENPAAGRLPLSMNFRSQPEMLAFVNAVFDGALGPEYEPLEAARAAAHAAALRRISVQRRRRGRRLPGDVSTMIRPPPAAGAKGTGSPAG